MPGLFELGRCKGKPEPFKGLRDKILGFVIDQWKIRMFAHPPIHPARHEGLIFNEHCPKGMLIIISDGASKQFKTVDGIRIVMGEVKIGLLRTSLGKVTHGHILQFVLVRHKGPLAAERMAG
jgi:hypothetical protein